MGMAGSQEAFFGVLQASERRTVHAASYFFDSVTNDSSLRRKGSFLRRVHHSRVAPLHFFGRHVFNAVAEGGAKAA